MNINIDVSVYLFKEDNNVIAYCPSMDLSGYGVTQKDAKDNSVLF